MFGILENQKDKRTFAMVVVAVLAALQIPQVATMLSFLDGLVPVVNVSFKLVLGVLGGLVAYMIYAQHF